MDFSEQIFKMLDEIKKHPEAMLGEKSLKKLYLFLMGYTCAYSHLTNRQFIFRGLFQEFIEKKYSLDGKYRRCDWATLLTQYFPEGKAFDTFFEELELFKKEVGVGPDSLLHGHSTRGNSTRKT